MKRQISIVHVSDWHGSTAMLPPADLYVVTGDMLPNFPFLLTKLSNGVREKRLANVHLLGMPRANDYHSRGRFEGRSHRYEGRQMVPENEVECQTKYVSIVPSFRENLGNKSAPVVVVRGNHDFIDLSTWIGGDVWEVNADSTRTFDFLGWKIGGFRGIKYIAGEWSDELMPDKMADIMDDLPLDIEILVSHSPPTGVFDLFPNGIGVIKSGGVQELRDWLRMKQSVAGPLELHCFGHVHESRNIDAIGKTTFSNAATTANMITLHPTKQSEFHRLDVDMEE